MRVFTPDQVARHTGSKYLGVLVAAKLARDLNEQRVALQARYQAAQLFGEDLPDMEPLREKLTTLALERVARGEVAFRLVDKRRPSAAATLEP